MELARRLDGYDTAEGCGSCIAEGTAQCCLSDDCTVSVCKRVAMELYEIAGKEAEDATTVSAYDLLSEEDRKAIAWVREHGGVNALSMGFQDADNRRIELCSSLGIDLETGWADAMVAMRRRLMPEGMEWPHFEDGEPVRVGDKLMTSDGAVRVEELSLTICDTDGGVTCVPFGERVKRPAVLAADGEPLEVGQTVWDVESGIEYEVVCIHTDEDTPVRVMRTDGSHLAKAAKPSTLTHERPVLDADGVPIKVGDTVWDIETGCGRTVRAVNDNGTVEFDGYENRGWFGRFLTHAKPEPPDSRRAIVNEIGDEMAARIDLLVSSGRWSDAD